MSAPNDRPTDDRADADAVAAPVAGRERAWREWMMIGVGLTGLLSILAIVVSVVALSSKTPNEGTTERAAAVAPMSATMNRIMGDGGQSDAGVAAGGSAQSVSMVMKSDTEHGKKGSDGQWHDAALPANFTVHPGETVTVTTLNYDDMPHTFTAPSLGANAMMPGGSESSPSKTTFTFKAPSKPGKYLWWCSQPCDPWAMAHIGFMRGYVTVAA